MPTRTLCAVSPLPAWRLMRSSLSSTPSPPTCGSWPATWRYGSTRGCMTSSFDQCMYGASVRAACACPAPAGEPHLIRKRTRLLSNDPTFCRLGKCCDNTHLHEPLQGQIFNGKKWVAKTSVAAAYPQRFCAAVARCSRLALEHRSASRAEERWRRLIDLYRAG